MSTYIFNSHTYTQKERCEINCLKYIIVVHSYCWGNEVLKYRSPQTNEKIQTELLCNMFIVYINREAVHVITLCDACDYIALQINSIISIGIHDIDT